jgi:ubiquinone/menaquinone biosynthesis C-methylase UbiE
MSNIIKIEAISDKPINMDNEKIIRQIKQNANITEGICLDVSSDGGYLGIAIAEMTDLSVYLFDVCELTLQLAKERIMKGRLIDRLIILNGTEQRIPIGDKEIDLVTGIGSIWLMSNYKKAFEEIYRILAPGGMACLQVVREERNSIGKQNKEWVPKSSIPGQNTFLQYLVQSVGETGIKNLEITEEGSDVWMVTIKKLS